MSDRPSIPPTKTGHATMRPRARLIALIGDELISDERVAVIELVKNAYDADATQVDLTFSGKIPSAPDVLTISDDGLGMTLETVLGGWFEPGTITKKKDLRSPSGRPYQGAKGVGRFAAARLAKTLYMETKHADATDGVVVLLNWGKFDDNSYLDQVEIDYEVRPLPDLETGTKLELSGLSEKKAWTVADFEALHSRLSRLISPFGEVKDFKINLVIPDQPQLTGEVEPHALTQRAKYRLTGRLNANGQFSGEIHHEGKVIKTLTNHPLGKKGEIVACGEFEVEIRAWDRDRLGLTPYMLEFNLGLREIRRVLDTYSGVSLYRDGFRVHPYGESGNDWLQLDNRSRQSPTERLANNQIIAAIRVSRDKNPEIQDRTTREGLVHNQAYDALCEWMTRVLALIEAERYRIRPRDQAKPEETHTLFEAFDLSPVVKEADRQLGRDHNLTQMIRKSDSDIREGVVRLQEHYSRLLMAAGLGQLVDLVIHEIGAPVGRANRELAYLEKKLKAYIRDDGGEIATSFQKIRGWLEQIAALRGRLDPKTAGQRGRSTTFDVTEEINGNIMLFENLLGKQNIKVSLHSPKQAVIVKMTRSALGQVLANLFDNSIYWLTRHHGDGNGGQIDIKLTSQPRGFTIQFCDDGPGVESSDRERAFDAYFTLKPNGMGLGLYIARQVMNHYGKLLYRDDCPLAGAGFEAIFSKNVGL